ncbi:MAG TPA: methyl-accepting chemotaxis protein, partial [Desulfosporosinus sp.]|nr:methyl-accepting chemotaxis protein [Desulfosporosinus sp.]
MKWFKNLKTFYKINALVVVMAIFMLGLSFMGYYFYNQANQTMNTAYSNALTSVNLINEANANVRMLRSINLELLLAPVDPSRKLNLVIQSTVLNGLIKESLNKYEPLAKGALEISNLAAVREAIQKYNDEWHKVSALMDSGDKEGAYTYFSLNATKDLEDINTLLPQLVDFSTQKAKSTIIRQNLNFVNVGKLLLIFPLIAAVLAVLIGALVARSIAKPLQTMLKNVQELASGNLRVPKIKNTSKDEAGQLAQAFNLMTDSLSGLVKKVSESSSDVAASAHQLLTITKHSSSASGQIAQSIAEVAGGTEKQADSVNETVSALEQLNVNIQLVAEAGHHVTALTTKTATTTENG